MGKVRRLDALDHFEDAPVRDAFDIEDAREKPNGFRALRVCRHPEHRIGGRLASRRLLLYMTRLRTARPG
jgi:hypothetical protein